MNNNNKLRTTIKITVLTLFTACLLVAAATTEARAQFETRVFSGLRFGGSFNDYGYQNNALLERLDIASGAQYGASFYFPIGHTALDGGGTKIELMFNFQKSDLRFKPTSISSLPDSIKDRFEVDGDKLILGEINVKYIHVGMMHRFGSDSEWIPHFNFSLGTTILTATDGDLNEKEFSFSIGGGVTRMFTESIGSQFQLRGYFTSLPSDVFWNDRYGGVWRTRDHNMFFQGEISGGLVFSF